MIVSEIATNFQMKEIKKWLLEERNSNKEYFIIINQLDFKIEKLQ